MNNLSMELTKNIVIYFKKEFNLYDDIFILLSSYLKYELLEDEYNSIIEDNDHFEYWYFEKEKEKDICKINLEDLFFSKWFNLLDIEELSLDYSQFPGMIEHLAETERYRKMLSLYIIEKFENYLTIGFNNKYQPDIQCMYILTFIHGVVFTEKQLKYILYNTEISFDALFETNDEGLSIFKCIIINLDIYSDSHITYYNIVKEIIYDNRFDKKHLFENLYDPFNDEEYIYENVLVFLYYLNIDYIKKLLKIKKITIDDTNKEYNGIILNDIIYEDLKIRLV